MQAEQLKRLRLANEALAESLNQPAPPPLPVPTIASLKSFGLFNGVMWNGMTELQRTTYVVATQETLMTEAPDKSATYLPEGVTDGQLATAVTNFYEEPERLWVPVHFALWAVRLQFEGKGHSYIDGFLVNLKDALTNASQK